MTDPTTETAEPTVDEVPGPEDEPTAVEDDDGDLDDTPAKTGSVGILRKDVEEGGEG